MSNAERFINAFSQIENELAHRLNAHRYIPYAEMIRRLVRLDPIVRRYGKLLDEFGDLRNAIVHERIDGEVIAEPHIKEVERIERLANLLTQIPGVFPSYERKVDFAFSDEKLSVVLSRMRSKKYSKLPIYSRKHEFESLLTTDAIAYYLFDHLSSTEMMNTSISEIIKSDVKGRGVIFISKRANLIEVLIHFEAYLHQGKRLNALIITEDGLSTQKPLGIISVSDLPNIYHKTNINGIK